MFTWLFIVFRWLIIVFRWLIIVLNCYIIVFTWLVIFFFKHIIRIAYHFKIIAMSFIVWIVNYTFAIFLNIFMFLLARFFAMFKKRCFGWWALWFLFFNNILRSIILWGRLRCRSDILVWLYFFGVREMALFFRLAFFYFILPRVKFCSWEIFISGYDKRALFLSFFNFSNLFSLCVITCFWKFSNSKVIVWNSIRIILSHRSLIIF